MNNYIKKRSATVMTIKRDPLAIYCYYLFTNCFLLRLLIPIDSYLIQRLFLSFSPQRLGTIDSCKLMQRRQLR